MVMSAQARKQYLLTCLRKECRSHAQSSERGAFRFGTRGTKIQARTDLDRTEIDSIYPILLSEHSRHQPFVK